MAEHTPLPWHVGATEHTELVMGFKDDSECVLAELDTDDVPMDESQANAAYIVQACNAFPELVSALQIAEAVLNEHALKNGPIGALAPIRKALHGAGASHLVPVGRAQEP